MPFDHGQYSAAGTLVATALEEAGHRAQSHMLDLLNAPFGQSLGGLIYLIGIVGAIITVAIGGNYKLGRWLLLGPAVLTYLISSRVQSQGVHWEFGTYRGSDKRVDYALRGVNGASGAESPGKISKFFDLYNRLITLSVQEIIDKTRLTGNKNHLNFVGKTDRYLGLFNSSVKIPYLKNLLNLTLNNQCAHYYALKRVKANENIRTELKMGDQKVSDGIGDPKVFNRGDVGNEEVNEYLKGLKSRIGGSAIGGIGGGLALVGTGANLLDQQMFSCSELWKVAVLAVQTDHSDAALQEVVNLRLPDGLSPEQALTSLKQKFAMVVENGHVILDRNKGVDISTGDQALVLILSEITARTIFKELSQLQPNLIAIEMDSHMSLTQGTGAEKMRGETSRAIRRSQKSDEMQYKGEVIAAALSLPYLQGLLLYALCVAFPFFCLFTILPGRHTSILTWMGLWAWAKMWDLGFCIVMIIDNMLYALLPHGTPIGPDILADPGLAIKTVMEVDPLYTANTYYNLISFALFSVPVITAFIVGKAGGEIVSIFSDGMKDFAGNFGNSLASFERGMMIQRDSNASQDYRLNAVNTKGAQAVAQSEKNQDTMRQLAAVQNDAAINSRIIDAIGKMGNQGLDQAISGAIAVEGTKLSAEAERLKGILIADVTEQLHNIDFNASNSDQVMMMSAMAVSTQWNSHDFSTAYPEKQNIAAVQAAMISVDGKVADAAYQKAARVATGQGEK